MPQGLDGNPAKQNQNNSTQRLKCGLDFLSGKSNHSGLGPVPVF